MSEESPEDTQLFEHAAGTYTCVAVSPERGRCCGPSDGVAPARTQERAVRGRASIAMEGCGVFERKLLKIPQ